MERFLRIAMIVVSLSAMIPLTAVGDTSPAGALVRLYGSSAVMEKVFEPARDALLDSLGVGLFLAGIGEGNGLESLIDGECDGAMLSSPLPDAVRDMTRFGKRDIPSDLQEHAVASERVWVMVNPFNPVLSISRRDLAGIFSGRITNWRELGGPDLRIVPVQPPTGTAARRALIRELLAGDDTALQGIETSRWKDVANHVRFLDGAIGAMPIPALPPAYMKFRVVETEEIRYSLYLVTRGTPSPDVERILESLPLK